MPLLTLSANIVMFKFYLQSAGGGGHFQRAIINLIHNYDPPRRPTWPTLGCFTFGTFCIQPEWSVVRSPKEKTSNWILNFTNLKSNIRCHSSLFYPALPCISTRNFQQHRGAFEKKETCTDRTLLVKLTRTSSVAKFTARYTDRHIVSRWIRWEMSVENTIRHTPW
jgi:hypothetical protein